jgi:hypothetical protein
MIRHRRRSEGGFDGSFRPSKRPVRRVLSDHTTKFEIRRPIPASSKNRFDDKRRKLLQVSAIARLGTFSSSSTQRIFRGGTGRNKHEASNAPNSKLPGPGCHVYACVDMLDPVRETCLRERKHGTGEVWGIRILVIRACFGFRASNFDGQVHLCGSKSRRGTEYLMHQDVRAIPRKYPISNVL